jgi:alpha-beta hydrolase superfamily lysophospholipase
MLGIETLELTTWVCFGLAIASFVAFVILAFSGRGAGQATARGGLDDVAKLVDALQKLAATLSKSGPWLSALIASLFFAALGWAAAAANQLPPK